MLIMNTVSELGIKQWTVFDIKGCAPIEIYKCLQAMKPCEHSNNAC